MSRIILIQSEIELIKEYLRPGTCSIASMSISQRRNFLKRMRFSSFFLNENILCLREPSGSERICIADDDTEKLNEILTSMHLLDHTGMKAMYMYSKRKYSGFKRERTNNFVSNCLICRQHQLLRRISPIIPIISAHPWALVQMNCIDMRNYQDVNDGYERIVNIIESMFNEETISTEHKEKYIEKCKKTLAFTILIIVKQFFQRNRLITIL